MNTLYKAILTKVATKFLIPVLVNIAEELAKRSDTKIDDIVVAQLKKLTEG